MQAASEFRDHLNHGAAALNRELFEKHGVFAISLFGPRKCGKTTLLEATLTRLWGELRIGVIVGNVLADQDALRLRHWSKEVTGIEALDLDAALVHEALERIDLSELDVVLIERSGAEVLSEGGYEDLGQAANVGLFTAAEPDTLVRHSQRIEHSDLLILTQVDLLQQAPMRLTACGDMIHRFNAGAPLIAVSTTTGEGLDQWITWLTSHAHRRASCTTQAIQSDSKETAHV